MDQIHALGGEFTYVRVSNLQALEVIGLFWSIVKSFLALVAGGRLSRFDLAFLIGCILALGVQIWWFTVAWNCYRFLQDKRMCGEPLQRL